VSASAIIQPEEGRRLGAALALDVAGLGPQGELLEVPELEGIYLLHLDPPFKHAAHYLGWAYNVRKRVREHRSGSRRCSPLLRAQLEAGGEILLARVWPGGDRTLERKMKNQGGLSRHCPLCRAAGRWHR